MLEQHPVPQNVTSFQFRLIGDMTLKQFGYLAAGAILAYISYNLPLPFFFTWPLATLFGLGGIGFAFVPVEQRPMDVWFLSFVKSVYSPTLYVWQRENPTTTVTSQKSNSLFPFSLPVIPLPPPPQFSKKDSLAVPGTKQVSPWQSLFAQKKQSATPASAVPPTTHQNTPNISVSTPPVKPSSTPTQPSPTLPTKEVAHPPTTPAPQYATQPPTPPPAPEEKKEHQVVSLESKLEAALRDKKRLEEELASIRQMLAGQQKQPTPSPVEEKQPPYTPIPQRSPANVITGVLRGQTGELLHSILVTVKDKDDVPLRALKTNKAGQFASSTPLPNGTYTIEVEDPKGMFFFQNVTLTLDGTMIEPVVIVAKTKQDLERQKLADALFGKKD